MAQTMTANTPCGGCNRISVTAKGRCANCGRDRVPEQQWAIEHGTEYKVPAIVWTMLTDISWHNDSCPRFTISGVERFSLWVEHVDPTSRENDSEPRFIITDDEDVATLWVGDNPEHAVAALNGIAKAFLLRASWGAK